MTVVVVGDATLDVSVAPQMPGVRGGDMPASVSLGPGGQGANVAVRLARRGVTVRLVTTVGADPAGTLLPGLLREEGIDVRALPALRSSLVVVLLDEAGERTMLSDRAAIDPAAAVTAMQPADWVHVSGYALADDRSGDELATGLAGLGSPVRVSVAGGSFPDDPALIARIRARLSRAGLHLLVLNISEAASLLGEATSASAAARALGSLATITVVTDGSRGSALAHGGLELVELPSNVGETSIDSTGAGDAFVATLIAELLPLTWPPSEEQLRAGLQSASRSGADVAAVRGAQARVPSEPGDAA